MKEDLSTFAAALFCVMGTKREKCFYCVQSQSLLKGWKRGTGYSGQEGQCLCPNQEEFRKREKNNRARGPRQQVIVPRIEEKGLSVRGSTGTGKVRTRAVPKTRKKATKKEAAVPVD